MSEEKRKKATKTVDLVGLSAEDSVKAAELRFDENDFNEDRECMFSIEVVSNPDNENICTTRVAMMGNLELFVAAILNSMKTDENLRRIISILSDEVMLDRISEQTGMSKEEIIAKGEEMSDDTDKEISKIIPMGGGADA